MRGVIQMKVGRYLIVFVLLMGALITFGDRGLIDNYRMKDKLMGHWMYIDDRQLRRLQMCSTCRTQDALSSQDMKSWSRL